MNPNDFNFNALAQFQPSAPSMQSIYPNLYNTPALSNFQIPTSNSAMYQPLQNFNGLAQGANNIDFFPQLTAENLAGISGVNQSISNLNQPQSWAQKLGLGANLQTLQLGIGGLQTLGNLYNSFEANKLAKEQLSFTKNITNKNLANSIKTYNTALEDRIGSRAVSNGLSQEEAQAYIAKNRL